MDGLHRYGELYLHKSESMKTKVGKWFDDEMKSAVLISSRLV